MQIAVKPIVSRSQWFCPWGSTCVLVTAAWACCEVTVGPFSRSLKLSAADQTKSNSVGEPASGAQVAPEAKDSAEIRVASFLALLQEPTPDASRARSSSGLVPSGAVPSEAAQPPDRGPRFSLPRRTPTSRTGDLGDWREAGVGEDRLSRNMRAHWVTLSAAGSLSGRMTTLGSDGEYLPATEVTVTFVQSGQVSARVTTDVAGEFRLDDFAPGVYSVVASGRNGFAAYSLIVLPHAERISGHHDGTFPVRLALARGQPVEDRLQMDVTALSPTFDTLRNLLEQYYPQMEVSTLDGEAYERILDDLPREDPQRLGFRELADAPPSLPPASNVRARPVYLQPDGTLRGRLMGIDPASGRPQMVRRMNLFIIRNDLIVARSSVDELGIFEIRGLRVGSYGVIAAGQDGFGAMAFELAAPISEASRPGGTDGTEWVKFQNQPESGSLSVGVVGDPRDLAAALSDVPPPEQVPAPAAASGGGDGNNNNAQGGGAGGGGGGGGSESGMGFLAAGLIGAAAANNNDTRGPASPTTPLPNNDF
jgi:hypothetical protein